MYVCVCLCPPVTLNGGPVFSPLIEHTAALPAGLPLSVNVPEQNDSLIISVSFKLMVIFLLLKKKKTDRDF